jgi:hypothetical protein
MDRKNEASWGVLRLNDPSIPSFEDEQHPFNFYVHRAGKVDPTAAPEGCDSIMVLVPCCTLQRDKKLAKLSREDTISGYSEQFNEVLIHKVRASVLDRLSVLSGLEGLKDNIVDEVVDTPATYADDFNLAAGLGVAGVTRPDELRKEATSTVVPEFVFGGGIQFFATQDIVLRVEGRGYVYQGAKTESNADSFISQLQVPTEFLFGASYMF